MQTFPDTLELLKAGTLDGARKLTLRQGLTSFPEEIYRLADSLEILDLSGNALSTLPDDLPRLHKLRILFCSSNQFTHLPDVLGKCQQLDMIGFKANMIHEVSSSAIPTTKLRWLILTDNVIQALPENLGDCQHMQKLMLAGNQLQRLPASLVNCKQLELLRISANHLSCLPEWIFRLPKLSWLAFAGNPFNEQTELDLLQKHQIPQVEWKDLTMQKLLGEGASGHIYQAILNKSSTECENVAVKVFKSGLTSDGLPRCEANATALAGAHPHLPGLIGKLSGHPVGADGLVMQLLPENLKVLAAPPSFETCSRDVYAEDTQFRLAKLLKIAVGIANACNHLHQCGISHGDLYAHNILSDDNGHAILSDFGGASFLPSDNQALSKRLQQIESRAFGCLLEEMLQRCSDKSDKDKTIEALWKLQKACTQKDIFKRPLFDEIANHLALLN